MNKVQSSILIAVIFVFLISIYAITVQSFNVGSSELATIIGGVLSMIGGAFGAFGAYLVAVYQMNKEKEQYEIREKIKSRPIVYCYEFQGPTKLKDTNLKFNTRIISTDFYRLHESSEFFNFYEIKIISKEHAVFAAKIKVVMEERHGEHRIIDKHLGIMENNVEVYIPLPTVIEEEGNVSYPEKVELEFETFEGEKFRYEYSPVEKTEKYFLIENNNEELIKELHLTGSDWILPGRKLKSAN